MNDILPNHGGIAAPLDLCDPQLTSRFDNSFVRELPADPLQQDIPRPVRNACYSRVKPSSVAAPSLLAWSDAVGALLGIARPQSATAPAAQVLGGNRVLPGMQPYAARYGGHQFGNWAGQLGDGRAMTLVEMIGADGRRRELQIKGAGRTPYSRRADGRAVLRSSLREFLCSEAMHYLGVPTTRALSLVATGAKGRRYCYGRQPEIAQWNLLRLAGALSALIPSRADLEAGIDTYARVFAESSRRIMADKLGLLDLDESDDALVADLDNLLHEVETNMTLFYRHLADVPTERAAASLSNSELVAPLQRAFYANDADPGRHLLPWLRRYVDRMRRDRQAPAARRARMNRCNPKYVARNYLAQLAIDALEQGDASVIERLLAVLERPYDEQPEHVDLAVRRPEWARHKAGCSALSCSS
ncbi:MAG: protein adenylyltransferase SelO family protein [Sulfuritalea sp.]|nr:protein adenylyltransferase SelO family protein [Sulfuritalea sp.]